VIYANHCDCVIYFHESFNIASYENLEKMFVIIL